MSPQARSLWGVPIGLLTAIYMSRFASPRINKVLLPAVQLLAGIPSVVYGFFGMIVMVPAVQAMVKSDFFKTVLHVKSGKGMSLFTASLLLGIMILPTIITVSKTSLDAVPQSYYEGAWLWGLPMSAVCFARCCPPPKSGVMSAVILGVGRAIGETMAVVMVAGNQTWMPKGLFQGLRTMTSNIVIEMGYAADLHREALIATGVVLFVFILLINLCFSLVKGAKRMADFAATAGKTDDMTHANAKSFPRPPRKPHGGPRVCPCHALAGAAGGPDYRGDPCVPDRLYPGQRYSKPQAVPV